LATEEIRYLSYPEAVLTHIEVMRILGELRYGVADRTLVESALARAPQAAAYENADVIRQAATMCFGLIKNHPWFGGNKRTATVLMSLFLKLNGYRLMSTTSDNITMCLAIESDRWKVDELEAWLRTHVI
jgi:death on curing protein